MTNQNSAAQAGNKNDIAQRLRDQAGQYEQDPVYMVDAALNRAAAAEIERLRAELCKLRAPVAEPAIVGWRDPDCGRMAQKGPPHGYNRYSEALMTVAEHRALMAAVLASAPVAVEQHDGLRTLLAELPCMHEDPKKGDAVFRCGVNGALNVVERRIRELLRSAPVAGEAQHPDDIAVDSFAVVMKAKLAKKRAEGRGGWSDKSKCTAEFLSKLLRGHVEKGDPVDVGNLAMMLHQRSESIAPAAGDALDAHFDLWQDDMVVASASGPRSQALEEIQHYATVYGQDGPVQIEEVIRIPLSDELAAQRKGGA